MTLAHEKRVNAVSKAYSKLPEEQKSFVNPENAAYLENEVLPRLKELQDNKKLIQDAEKLVKKVPAAAKIKASDEDKLNEALETVQEVEHRGLKIDEKLEQKLLESKAAFDEGMQKSEELRNLISQLDENHMDKDMAALYEQAQDSLTRTKALPALHDEGRAERAQKLPEGAQEEPVRGAEGRKTDRKARSGQRHDQDGEDRAEGVGRVLEADGRAEDVCRQPSLRKAGAVL